MNTEEVSKVVRSFSIYKQRKNYVNVEEIANQAIEHGKQFEHLGKEEKAYQMAKFINVKLKE